MSETENVTYERAAATFKAAQERDMKYLVSLEPDRMLHNFRTNVGLEAKAPVYGGWESAGTWEVTLSNGSTFSLPLTVEEMNDAGSAGCTKLKQAIIRCFS